MEKEITTSLKLYFLKNPLIAKMTLHKPKYK